MSEQTREIDGVTFTVQRLPPRKALNMERRLAAIGVPALAAAFIPGTSTGLEDAELGNLGAAAAILFDRLPEKEMNEIHDQLLASALVTRDGTRAPLLPIYDSVIPGVQTIHKLLWFAIEANFGPFGGALVERIKAGALLAASKSRSQTTSPGPSGG
jgi:hypothetical protein